MNQLFCGYLFSHCPGKCVLFNIARKHHARINVKPVDFGKIFPASGGVPVAKRAPQRQKYRLVELARWQKHVGIPLTIQPKYFPYDATIASLLVVAAADELGEKLAMLIASAIFKGCWVEERNMGGLDELSEERDQLRLLFACASELVPEP